MENEKKGAPQVTPREPEPKGSGRDTKEGPAKKSEDAKEKSLDKTLADSFPSSDPPSSIPDPEEGEDAA